MVKCLLMILDFQSAAVVLSFLSLVSKIVDENWLEMDLLLTDD